MSDSYTETTQKSWGSRLGDSIKGVLFGLVLIIGSVIGLFWNEGRAVQTAKSLAEGAGLVIDIDAARVDPTNEGKLVHVSGEMKAGVQPRDPQFGVAADGLRLVRKVEMYQWKEEKKTETKKNLGGSEETVTTYTYVRTWSEGRIDSRDFKQQDGHVNPELRYRTGTFPARDVTLGAFKPGEAVVKELPADRPVRVDQAMAEALRGRIAGPVSAVDGVFYLGADAAQPGIGDLRVSYTVTPAGPVSIVGRQSGVDFTAYQTKAGDRLLMVQPGTASAVEMFKAAESANAIFTWILRPVGVVAMFIGFALILNPLVVVADVVPFIGNVLGAGASLVSLIATAVLAPLVIAIAWLWYRPLVSIVVIVVGLAAAFGLRRLAARKTATAAQPAPAR
jgi:hypothetical protein